MKHARIDPICFLVWIVLPTLAWLAFFAGFSALAGLLGGSIYLLGTVVSLGGAVWMWRASRKEGLAAMVLGRCVAVVLAAVAVVIVVGQVA